MKSSYASSRLVAGLALLIFAGFSSAQSYYRRDVRDYDQKRHGLEANGKNHCVPTAYADILRFMAVDGGFGNLDQGYNGSYDSITNFIKHLGNLMDTDGDSGTNFDDGVEACAEWIDDHSGQFFVHTTFGPGSNWGTDRLRHTMAMGWMARIGYSRYMKDGDEWERHGGHALALAGYDYRTSDKKIIVANPSSDDSIYSQSPFNLASKVVANHHITTEDYGYVAHARWSTWTKDGHSWQAMVDKMHVIQPMWAGWVNAPFTTTPPLLASLDSSYVPIAANAWTFRAVFPAVQDDGVNPVIRERTIELPGPVKDWCMDPGQAAIYVLTQDGTIHHIDLLDRATKKITSVKNARKLAVAGRDFELFVLEDGPSTDNLWRINPESLKKTSLKVAKGITSIEPDPATLGVVGLSAATRKVVKVDPLLKKATATTIELPEGDGEVLMNIGRKGEVAFTRAGAGKFIRAGSKRLAISQASNTRSFHAVGKNRFIVQDGERLLTFDSAGKAVPSMFDAVQATGLVRLSHGWKGITRAEASKASWRETPPGPGE